MGRLGKSTEVPVRDLVPYANNARIHTDEQVAQIAKSIAEFGFLNPVLIDKDKNIIAGHGRIMAAKKLGMETVPALYVEGLTEEQRRAYILADNRLTEIGGWDMEIVKGELKALEDEGFDTIITGFNMEAIDITDDMGPEMTQSEFEDYKNAAPVRVKHGEIWRLGSHRLMCGDSTSRQDVQKLMDGKRADLLVTDPPYNVALGIGDTPEVAKKRHRRMDGLKIENDAMDSAEFSEFLETAFRNAQEVLKEGAAFYCWYASTSQKSFQTALEASGLLPHQILIWVKSTLVLGRQDYHWRHEPCFYGWKEGGAHYFIDVRSFSTVMDKLDDMTRDEIVEAYKELASITTTIYEDKPKASELHPTMKPLGLFKKLIRNSSREGDLVLDLFCGSGTTIMAAEEMGRRCNAMEYDPHYCDVIIERWEQLTGKEAVRV